MKANVRNVRSDLDRHLHRCKIVNAVRHVKFAQQLKHRRDKPTLITKLNRVRVLSRERRKKLRQPLDIYVPLRRKLKQDRSKLLLQPLRDQKKLFRRTSRLLQLLHMRDETAGFQRETKVGWRRLSPGVERLRCRQSIEAIVDFDRVEVARVELEHFGRAPPGCRKQAERVFVVPPCSPEESLHPENTLILSGVGWPCAA